MKRVRDFSGIQMNATSALLLLVLDLTITSCGDSPLQGENHSAGYIYKEPTRISDGWEVSSLDTMRVEVKRILREVENIRNGIYPEIHSFLVISKGKLILEEYFPGHNSSGSLINYGRDIPHEVQSASKSYRSALIGIAIDRGYIQSVDSKMFSFFPEYAQLSDERKEKITLHHLLTMSSGLDWDEWSYSYNDPRNTLRGMYQLPYAQWTSYFLSRPIAFEPGTRWNYNTGTENMLNGIIIKAIDISFADFVKHYLSDPLECTRLPGVGNPLGGETTPRDMAKFGYLYLNDGQWKGKQVVSKAWIEKSTTKYFQLDRIESYGYQWWLRNYSSSKATYASFYASGNGGQYIIAIKDLDLVIVFTGGNFNNGQGMSLPFSIVENSVIPAFE
jgi:CubicO group peptidase (beta-lactamase class C family)